MAGVGRVTVSNAVWDKPGPLDAGERDLIEAVVRFAAVSRFVIADLSDPRSIPAELQAIVPQFPSLPVVPIIEATQREYPVSELNRSVRSAPMSGAAVSRPTSSWTSSGLSCCLPTS